MFKYSRQYYSAIGPLGLKGLMSSTVYHCDRLPERNRYSGTFHDDIRSRFETTVDLVLRLKGAGSLLDHDPVLRRALRLRNPYVDPMSLIQVDLLRRWRDAGSPDGELLDTLLLTVNGIAHGLQNTG